jgi:hypothetical protein
MSGRRGVQVVVVGARAGETRKAAPEAVLVFGRKTLAPETSELKPGDVIELDAFADDPVELVRGGKLIARGQAVVAGGALAMRVGEVRTGLLAMRGMRAND